MKKPHCFFLRIILVSTSLFFSNLLHATTAITTVGTGSCLPMPHRKHPANLLQIDTQYFLIDSGPGTLHALTSLGIQANNLDGAFYTHFHIDHIGELVNIITWFQVADWKDEIIQNNYSIKPFTIYAPHGINEHIQSILPLTPAKFLPNSIKIVEVYDTMTINLGTASVVVGKVPHTQESVGYRFTFANKKIVAITGDTSADESVINLLNNADVAIIECSYSDSIYEEMKKFVHHLGPTSAAQLAEKAHVKLLVLTHLYPCADIVDTTKAAAKVFSGTTITAYDGMRIALN